MNHTFIIIDEPDITEGCFDWCKEQHFINNSNLGIEALLLVAFAMVVLFIWFVYNSGLGQKLTDNLEYEQKETINKIIRRLPDFALYLLIGFFIYWKWFL